MSSVSEMRWHTGPTLVTHVSVVSLSSRPKIVSSCVSCCRRSTPLDPKAGATQPAGIACTPRFVDLSPASFGDELYHAGTGMTIGAGVGGNAPTALMV